MVSHRLSNFTQFITSERVGLQGYRETIHNIAIKPDLIIHGGQKKMMMMMIMEL
jgi:hypothetical protein